MSELSVGDDSPGTALFPEYATLYRLIAAEVEGLTDEQFDFESDRWEWSKWSIRRQLSHMASLIYRWLVVRWGDTLYPDGGHGVDDVQGVADSGFDRRMHEGRYWEISAIMGKLKDAIGLAGGVLSGRTVGFLRAHTFLQTQSPQWSVMTKAHPTGITPTGDPSKAVMTLEATMRHIYFEEITHLHNVQRLKRAQGLRAVVELPRVGYWTLDEWDNSEP